MKKNKHTIYIPSKGRADNCITANELIKDNLNFKIVIEPNDLYNYSKIFNLSNLIVLDKNNMGIAYSRQFIKEYSIYNKEKYHWQMDDDLIFYKRINNKNKKYSVKENIIEIEKYIKKYKNIGIAGMRNMVFAFSIKNKISINSQCVSSFLINNKTKAKFRPDIIEDTDYNMQVLTEKYCTLIFNRLLFSNPPVSKNFGGNTENHYNKIEFLQKNLMKMWPKCFDIKYNKKDNLTKIKPSKIWRTFSQKPLKYNEKSKILELGL
tara:strand:+ start:12109 stop:12900 length:792 start_codon:yes stop_codon:yes gene_type:complete